MPDTDLKAPAEVRYSRWFLYFGAPIFLALATVFVLSRPEFRQQILVDFLVVYYLIILLSKRLFGRPPDRASSPVLQTLGEKNAIPKSLLEMAQREYEYVQETMAQAMNDRHTLVNYFLLAAGVVIAAIGSVYSSEGMQYSPYKSTITIGISLILTTIAWIYFLKMVRLRQAWCESSIAMSRIKEFVLRNEGLSDDDARSPFLWKTTTVPRAYKMGTLYHLEVILISFISSLAIGLSSVLLMPAEIDSTNFWIPGSFALYHFLVFSSCYFVFLGGSSKTPKDQKPRNAVASQESAERIAESVRRPESPAPPPPRRVVVVEEAPIHEKVFKIVRAVLKFEKFDGNMTEEVERMSFERGHSAGILLQDTDTQELVLVEQFRYPAYSNNKSHGWLIEIMAGMVGEGETAWEVVKREAREELGYDVKDVELLAEFYASPGGSSERISVFFGKLGAKIGAGGGLIREGEDIRMIRLSVEQAYRDLEQGLFQDAKTIIALLLAKERMTNNDGNVQRMKAANG